MSGATVIGATASRTGQRRTPMMRRRLLIGLALLLTAGFMLLPIAAVFGYAFAKGIGEWWTSIIQPDTVHAIQLTLLAALVSVPLNTAFGICAAWSITKFRFRGRKLLITLIEIPFSISPIVAGVSYLMLYGAQGLIGGWLDDQGIQLMFAAPGIILVTMFVTSPFVARELIPLMQTQGSDEEEAAISLGAGGLFTFLKVTLPNIKWALLHGIVLCSARAVGEFGAVSVVSGHIRGQTNTLPLQIDLLYNDYNATAAFAAASILTLIALLTLVLKTWFEGHR